jgi:hypothetical protein
MIKLAKLLLEIGDSTPYSTQISSEQGDIYDPKQAEDNFLQYKFTTDEGAEYEVNIEGRNYPQGRIQKYYLDVDFTADSGYKLTGEGKPMKIMATVTSILKKVLEGDVNKNIKGISYSAVEEISDRDFWNPNYKAPKGSNKRDNMYRMFITRATEGKVKFKEVDGATIATLTDR